VDEHTAQGADVDPARGGFRIVDNLRTDALRGNFFAPEHKTAKQSKGFTKTPHPPRLDVHFFNPNAEAQEKKGSHAGPRRARRKII
jgi:hypothetical protein